jgi:tetratricopeptide (TPR) repeat protein
VTPRRALVRAGMVGAVLGAVVLGLRGWQEMRRVGLRRGSEAARTARDWERLERTALEWATVAPDDATPLLLAAEAAVARRAIDRAADHLGRVPDDDPRAVDALLQRVDMLFGELARPFEAAATCERILAIAPAYGAAHQRLVFFHAVTMQRTRAAAAARRAIMAAADIPETYVYLVGSDWLNLSNTTAVNARWLVAHPDEEVLMVAAARGDIASRGLDGSIEGTAAAEADGAVTRRPDDGLRALLARFPANPELLAYFLQRATTAGDIGEVTDLLARVPAASFDDNRFWRFKGWLHAARGEGAEAEAAYRRALELNAFDFASRHQLADALRRRGLVELAASQAALAAEGRSLRRAILEQPDVGSVAPELLGRIQRFAAASGETEVAARLGRRIGGG